MVYFILGNSTLLFHNPTKLHLTQLLSTIALLHSRFYTLPCFYFYTSLYSLLSLLYFTLLDSKLLYYNSHYLTLLPSTKALHCSTKVRLHSTDSTLPSMILLHKYSSLHYSTMVYFTQLDSTLLCHGSTSLYLTLHYSSMAILHSTIPYCLLP